MARFTALLLVVGFAACAPYSSLGAEESSWSYSSLVRPAVPALKQKTSHPIDAFLLARLEKAGLKFAPQAERLVLLKRVTYDLTGLLPTSKEVDDYLNDTSADAYEKVVDRLLASPRFGERWAQHWLDVVRYSESDGYKLDHTRDNAFRYRDYVIESFNADLPYDRFLRQQIAGEELEPGNANALVATGYLRLHPEETNGSNYRQIRQEILDDITDNFGMAFLGLTVGCAKCHDHKFDPISQKEYFQLQAFFTPLYQRDDLTVASPAEAKKHADQLADWTKATQEIRDKIEEIVAPVRPKVFNQYVGYLDEMTQEALRCKTEDRSSMQMQLAMLGGKQIKRQLSRLHWRLETEERKEYDLWKKKLDALEYLKPQPLPMAMAVSDVGPKSPQTFRLANGDYQRPKDEIRPGFLECLGETKATFSPPTHKPESTGRRTALAKWVTDPKNPLPARVIVNRLWQQYFGQGIVATPNDFGEMGAKPTHPEVIDFLATELVARNWKLKAIHRLIATSAAYRQSSVEAQHPNLAAARQADPDNRLLWHQRLRRRDGEAIRDAGLQVSGLLNFRMYGPSAQPDLPKVLADNKYGWYSDEKPEDRNRRSVYVLQRRNLGLPILRTFDAPDRVLSCATRPLTVSAPQALVLLNGEFTLAQAQKLAETIQAKASLPEQMVQSAYRNVLGREASPEEVGLGRGFLETGKTRAEAVVDLCHALLNSAEFLYVE